MDKADLTWPVIACTLMGSYFLTGVPGGASEACVTSFNFMDRDPYCKMAIKMDSDLKHEQFMQVRTAYIERHTTRGQATMQLQNDIGELRRTQNARYQADRWDRQRQEAQDSRNELERSEQRQQDFYDRMNRQREDTQRKMNEFMNQ